MGALECLANSFRNMGCDADFCKGTCSLHGVENTHHNFFSLRRRQHRDTEVNFSVVDFYGKTTVLRLALFVKAKLCENFNTCNNRRMDTLREFEGTNKLTINAETNNE